MKIIGICLATTLFLGTAAYCFHNYSERRANDAALTKVVQKCEKTTVESQDSTFTASIRDDSDGYHIHMNGTDGGLTVFKFCMTYAGVFKNWH
jgi:hypothetical protein